MAINYTGMRDRTTALLKANGAVFSVERPGRVVRANGEEVQIPATHFNVTGVLTSYKPNQIDGKNILSGDQQMSLTAEKDISVGDLVMIDGRQWRVEQPNPVKPAAVLICYKPQLRGV